MKKQKKLKKFNKPLAKVLKKVKALSKRMAPKSAKKPLSKVEPSKAAPAKPIKGVKTAPVRPGAAKVAAAKPGKIDKAAPVAKTNLKAAVAPKGKPQVLAAVLGKAKAPEASAAGKVPALKAKAARSAGGGEHSEKLCRENACENAATTKGYCRLDYIKNWKKIKRKEMILKEGKLNQYIEELVGKYPDKYIDVIRQDLSSEVSFNKVIHDLELDESIDDLDYDGDSIDALIGGIKKEDGGGFDDSEF